MRPDQSPFVYYRYTRQGVERVDGSVIGETPWTLYVNQAEIVTFMCTPRALHFLALGFMVSEGLIRSLGDVQMLRVYEGTDRCYVYAPALGLDETLTMHVCPESVGVMDARLRGPLPERTRRILTSGCGGGVTFDDLSTDVLPLHSTRRVTAGALADLMRELNFRARLYRTSRGVHSSLLAAEDGTLVTAEDVGRHNTLDKLRGECLLRGLATRDAILVTSGRISSEMMTKAVKMGAPILVSRTSPTWLSLQLAQRWNVTVVGYLRGHEMNVYTHPERILPPTEG